MSSYALKVIFGEKNASSSFADSKRQLEVAYRYPWIFGGLGFHEKVRIQSTLPKVRHTSGMALDIGCADCVLAKFLPSSMEYVGIDLSVLHLKKALGIHRIRCDARLLPFRNEVFDVVFAYEVLEHLHNPESSVLEVYRTLKKGGEFVLSTPNAHFNTYHLHLIFPRFIQVPSIVVYKRRVKQGGIPRFHYHFFNPSELDEMLHSYGFESKKINNILFEMPPGRFWKRVYVKYYPPWIISRLIPADFHMWLMRVCKKKC